METEYTPFYEASGRTRLLEELLNLLELRVLELEIRVSQLETHSKTRLKTRPRSGS